MVRALGWLRSSTPLLATAVVACTPSPAVRSVTGFAQGTTYSLQWTGGAAESDMAAAAAEELERIDALLSNYRPDSALERFNATRSTEAVELPAELVTLIDLAKRIYAASDGCFDPTVRPLVRAWGFDGDVPTVPSAQAIDAARATVGLDKLEVLDATRVRKMHPTIELDMASIGQGYTASRLANLLERRGSTAYLAEIGGEVVARGSKPGGAPWRIGIENPTDDGAAAPTGPALRIPSGGPTAIITSGSYRHYFELGGRRYGHIIDPRTGWPVEHALLSVTVVGRDAAAAAAWGTALLCLGPSAARAAADRENVAALFWVGDGSEPAALELTRALEQEWRGLLDERHAGP